MVLNGSQARFMSDNTKREREEWWEGRAGVVSKLRHVAGLLQEQVSKFSLAHMEPASDAQM